jgi:hypothetical protein
MQNMHLTPVILIENFPLIDIRQSAEPSKSDSGVEGIQYILPGTYIVRSAHKLRARRTVCKSVLFSNDINCWRKIGAYLA